MNWPGQLHGIHLCLFLFARVGKGTMRDSDLKQRL